MTIRQLLGHTSDIEGHVPPRLEAALRDPGHRWTEGELLEPMRRAAEPQGAHQYADSNSILLGAILRRAGGLGAEALLRREITAPLGRSRTSFRVRAALADELAGRGRLAGSAWGELFTDTAATGSASWSFHRRVAASSTAVAGRGRPGERSPWPTPAPASRSCSCCAPRRWTTRRAAPCWCSTLRSQGVLTCG